MIYKWWVFHVCVSFPDGNKLDNWWFAKFCSGKENEKPLAASGKCHLCTCPSCPIYPRLSQHWWIHADPCRLSPFPVRLTYKTQLSDFPSVVSAGGCIPASSSETKYVCSKYMYVCTYIYNINICIYIYMAFVCVWVILLLLLFFPLRNRDASWTLLYIVIIK